jgi:hypothetical protein
MAQGLGLGEERIEPDEEKTIAEIIQINLSTLVTQDRPVERGQHPKHHGCVRATFTVLPDVPAHLRRGIFAQPDSYDALIRFSNGRQQDDREPDAHGMAIKLLNVPGPKLMGGHEHETTQDFVLVDHETFFQSGLKDYAAFNRGSAAAKRGLVGKLLFAGKLKLFDRALLERVQEFAGKRPSSPLGTHYWSTTPYRLGTQAVKYMAVSHQQAPAGAGVSAKNGLSQALAAHLSNREARFDFGVHVQTDPERHPVEDVTVSWSRNGAEFVKLATIVIPKQDVDPKASLAQDLAFSPWHSLAEHRPLGAINRVRGAVYAAMSKKRHELNGVRPAGSSEAALHGQPADGLRTGRPAVVTTD